MSEGLFIVIYGINNLGKSTQARLLSESLNKVDLPAKYLKYPIYELKPTGPKINEVLRGAHGQQISEEELQGFYTQNRRDYQPQLIKMINEGVNVVAEDYIGTGLAWGWSKGADLEDLIAMNRGLVKPDIEILLDGERFIEAKEDGHLHESDEKLMERCRLNHLKLAEQFGWDMVNANQEIEEVHQDILEIMERKIKEIK
ncbi:MAG: hypothetical protein A2927_00440 [Candidatus Komeilibacteria bacterium RIFCSPLOWO2_01_FULL_45_10]|uniref:Thymidylate kinase-like domain-containing protein n=1 Tax=Candidatus Komeilibacteria bacterium RIFCSPLOWO2_01_FULL_45_10 TaxID=1798550 RepID=A0A1G2BJ92_9BACT|nr:MAG: hypothetical protein A2927_00440 [Candidatus Komeilibacteria bacterium RIFCSPLOWO2_01_FULL_45_10]